MAQPTFIIPRKSLCASRLASSVLSTALRFCFRLQQLVRRCFLGHVCGVSGWLCSLVSHPSWISPGDVVLMVMLGTRHRWKQNSKWVFLRPRLWTLSFPKSRFRNYTLPMMRPKQGFDTRRAEELGPTIQSTTAATSFGLWCKLLDLTCKISIIIALTSWNFFWGWVGIKWISSCKPFRTILKH